MNTPPNNKDYYLSIEENRFASALPYISSQSSHPSAQEEKVLANFDQFQPRRQFLSLRRSTKDRPPVDTRLFLPDDDGESSIEETFEDEAEMRAYHVPSLRYPRIQPQYTPPTLVVSVMGKVSDLLALLEQDVPLVDNQTQDESRKAVEYVSFPDEELDESLLLPDEGVGRQPFERLNMKVSHGIPWVLSHLH